MSASSRSAERRAERRDRRRKVGLLSLGALLAVFAGVNIVIAVDRSGGGARAGGGTNTPAADDRAGAYLTDQNGATAFLAGAVADIAAVASYDYRRLDDALSSGLAVTTGTYQRAFRAALSGASAQALRSSRTVQDFQLLASGVGTMTKTSAQILLVGEQTITSTAGRRVDDVTLLATVVRDGNQYLIANLTADANAGLPAGTRELRVAAEAGRAELAAVFTYRHENFDADYARALAGGVDPLRSRLTANAAATRAAVTAGGYDLTGTVTALAVEQATGTSVVLLMAATTTRTPGGSASQGAYEVTVVKAQGVWITSSISPVRAG